MVVNGTSWVGLGWRPRKLTASCRNFPVIRDFGDATAEPEPSKKIFQIDLHQIVINPFLSL